mmetsp:Transcript_17592/g.50011  ORF Transcript_17592/g.50011 Transcript_17592/m.50011 type:complete len:403 (+) Transcript_17592:569-1777(+)
MSEEPPEDLLAERLPEPSDPLLPLPWDLPTVVDVSEPANLVSSTFGRSKHWMRISYPATICSSPSAKIFFTAVALRITMRPRLPGRVLSWPAASWNGFTLECATRTRDTSPYWEKWRTRMPRERKPSLLIFRAMKIRHGSSEESSFKWERKVSLRLSAQEVRLLLFFMLSSLADPAGTGKLLGPAPAPERGAAAPEVKSAGKLPAPRAWFAELPDNMLGATLWPSALPPNAAPVSWPNRSCAAAKRVSQCTGDDSAADAAATAAACSALTGGCGCGGGCGSLLSAGARGAGAALRVRPGAGCTRASSTIICWHSSSSLLRLCCAHCASAAACKDSSGVKELIRSESLAICDKFRSTAANEEEWGKLSVAGAAPMSRGAGGALIGGAGIEAAAAAPPPTREAV